MSKKLFTGAAAAAAVLAVTGCSDSSSTNQNNAIENTTSTVSIGFSDAPIADLSSVTVAIDKIVFTKDGEDIEVDEFTSEDLGIADADTFSINLLEVQGNDNKLVLDSVDLPVGEYQDLRLHVDQSASFVNEFDRPETDLTLKVPSNVLKLGGFEVKDTSTQTFVVEFGLEQAMTYNPGPDRYILKPRGVRIVELEDASYIEGTLDFAALEGCTGSELPVSAYVYAYSGHTLDSSKLGDMFVREDDSDEPEIDEDVASDIIAPEVAVTADAETGGYILSYLPAGNYTLAMTCQTETDDPVLHDEFAIPSPSTELVEVTVGAGTGYQCDFPLSSESADNCTVIEDTEE